MTLCNGEVFSLPVVLAIPKACCGDTTATNVYWMSSTPADGTLHGRMMLRDAVSFFRGSTTGADPQEHDLYPVVGNGWASSSIKPMATI